jgi:hypothetical protein
METKDWIGIALTVWANMVATIALVKVSKKEKTAKRSKQTKPKRKR